MKAHTREFVWNYKNQTSCNLCKESHPAALTFHHIDPEKKKFSISWMIKRGFSIEEVIEEISKCEIICSNCHLKLHFEEKS